MITHTFISKCNTIIENSKNNTGLNPVAELNTGDYTSRILLDFDFNKIYNYISDNNIDTNNVKHFLKMTNCGSVNLPLYMNDVFIDGTTKKRAASFDIIAFKIPFQWDCGIGFNYNGDAIQETHSIVSKDGSNWFQAMNYIEWDEYGIYSNDTLSNEYYKKYKNGLKSIIIGEQHFDYGTENLEIDITDYINDIIKYNKEFHGIGLAFSPKYENKTKENRFISFFTNNTNTFFLPYIETINNITIKDDRYNFIIGNKNKLFLFVSDNGEYINLDYLPTCTINGVEYEVKQAEKGSYYIELALYKDQVEPDTILYDTWSNLCINGEKLDDVEMEFVVLHETNRFIIGKQAKDSIKLTPQLYGINNKERLKHGDVREINVDFIEEYSYGTRRFPSNSEYRIYVKENDREIDVFKYHPLDRKSDSHSFIIKTEELIPNDYHIDIKIKQGRNTYNFDNVLEFSIVDNVTNFYK